MVFTDQVLVDLELCFLWMRSVLGRLTSIAEVPRFVDVMILLGSPGAKRTAENAVELIAVCKPRVVFCCGGLGRGARVNGTTEAAQMKAIIESSGLPSGTILLSEQQSDTTLSNFEVAFDYLAGLGLPYRTVLIVHDGGCERRDINLLKAQFPEFASGKRQAYIWGCGTSFMDLATCGLFGEPEECAQMYVGTLQRVIEWIGDGPFCHIPDPPPPDVQAAFIRLKARFSEHIGEPPKSREDAHRHMQAAVEAARKTGKRVRLGEEADAE